MLIWGWCSDFTFDSLTTMDLNFLPQKKVFYLMNGDNQVLLPQIVSGHSGLFCILILSGELIMNSLENHPEVGLLIPMLLTVVDVVVFICALHLSTCQ
jgi:hypothetical protein